MFTKKYKEGYINGYCDKDVCIALYKGKYKECKNILAAKIWITKQIRIIDSEGE